MAGSGLCQRRGAGACTLQQYLTIYFCKIKTLTRLETGFSAARRVGGQHGGEPAGFGDAGGVAADKLEAHGTFHHDLHLLGQAVDGFVTPRGPRLGIDWDEAAVARCLA
jgi:hypothetical protein